jgi:hypothetical protein
MSANQFTCAMCGETFDMGRGDEEAKAESKERFGLEVSDETHDVICDDCFKALNLPEGPA